MNAEEPSAIVVDVAFHLHKDLGLKPVETLAPVHSKQLLTYLRLLNYPEIPDYFDEQLERIRDLRSSERRFYQKVLDIYATSVDYTPNTEMSQQFFATVQNKMHWAAHGQTAAEVIHARVDAHKPFMGLPTTRPK